MLRVAACTLILVGLLSGCASPATPASVADAQDAAPAPAAPPPAAAAKPTVTYKHAVLAEQDVDASSATGLSFDVTIPEGARGVTASLEWQASTFAQAHLDVPGCGSADWGAAIGLIGVYGPLDVCKTPQAGKQTATLTVGGAVLGQLVVEADVPA